MNSRQCKGRPGQQGFILAVTLWIVAGVTLLAALFHSYIERQVLQAIQLKQHLQNELQADATADTLHYLLATRRTTLAGLTLKLEDQKRYQTSEGFLDTQPVGEELRLDGRAYKGLGNIRFSIQDHAGMLGLNSPAAPELFEKILRDQLDSQRARELAAALADYVDANSIRRINGAEADQYQFSDLPGPTNWFLRTEAELAAVLRWRDLLEGETGAFWAENAGISYSNTININTASAELLAILLDIDGLQARELVDARNEYPFRSLSGVADLLGVREKRWQEAAFRFYPASGLRIKLWCDDCNSITVESLQLTESGFYGPWLTYHRYRTSREGAIRIDEPATLVPGHLFADPLPADG